MKIKIENLTKNIRGNTVLSEVNLELDSGKIYGLIGRNGSGKTMLLRAIAGLISPTEGNIYIDDKKLHKDISFPQDMGIIIENPELLSNITGFSNLKLLAKIKNKISDEDIKKWMKEFSLDPDSKKTVHKYSLGMKQKIGIIQALMEDPKLLILDEPFNALDEGTVDKLRNMFIKFKDEDKLIIITSHHAEDIDILCDEIVFMESGMIKKITKK